MLKVNPIRKRASSTERYIDSTRAVRRWVGVCPVCANEVSAGSSNGRGWLRGHTRKQAKDALYRHTQQEHRPGSVGR